MRYLSQQKNSMEWQTIRDYTQIASEFDIFRNFSSRISYNSYGVLFNVYTLCSMRNTVNCVGYYDRL